MFVSIGIRPLRLGLFKVILHFQQWNYVGTSYNERQIVVTFFTHLLKKIGREILQDTVKKYKLIKLRGTRTNPRDLYPPLATEHHLQHRQDPTPKAFHRSTKTHLPVPSHYVPESSMTIGTDQIQMSPTWCKLHASILCTVRQP